MLTLYYICARLYLLTSAIVIPIASIVCWLLVARLRHKRPTMFPGWLVPTAIGQTLIAVAVLLMLFVTFVDRRNYGLASFAYLLNLVAFAFGAVSLRRFWKMVDRLPVDPGHQPPGNASPPPQGVWPPPPSRPN